MYSIRRRLILVLAASFTVLVLAAGLHLERRLDARLLEEFDAALVEKALGFGARIEQEGGQIEMDLDPGDLPEFERETDAEYFRIWLDDGTPLLKSKSLGESDLAREPMREAGHALRDVTLPDGRRGRVVQLFFAPKTPGAEEPGEARADPAGVLEREANHAVIVALARSRERLDGMIASTRLTVALVGGALIVVAAAVVWVALRRGLRPLDRVAGEVAALDAATLDARVGEQRLPRELWPVVHQLNALLERLHASFERERRFSANVAHELRTPLAELRALAEVGAECPEETEAVVRFFEDVREIGGRMERLVRDLLLLARCEAGVERVERSELDLAGTVEACWSRLEPEARARGLRFESRLAPGVRLVSDPGKLEIIVSNLLANAVHHAPPQTGIECFARNGDGRFVFEVANRAAALTPADVPALCNRFWRKDAARSGGEHAGIGLSLVDALARLLDLEFTLGLDPEGRLHAKLAGPANA